MYALATKCYNAVVTAAQSTSNMLYPLRPVTAITEIAVGALSILTTPFTGPLGLVGGVIGLGKGAVDMGADLVSAGITTGKLIQKDEVPLYKKAHLGMTAGVTSLGVYAVLNPASAIIALKTTAVFIGKCLLGALAVL